MRGPAKPDMPADVLSLLDAPLTDELVLERLHSVIDPELGVDIVSLGLVYDVAVDAAGGVDIEMTLTTPGCPLGGMLEDDIRAALVPLPRVSDVRVTLVWDPPWEPEAMSDEARERLGWS